MCFLIAPKYSTNLKNASNEAFYFDLNVKTTIFVVNFDKT